jgi:hypothetical protein
VVGVCCTGAGSREGRVRDGAVRPGPDGYDPVFPGKPGFGARRIETDEDVADVIVLMRLNYERVVERHAVLA